MELDSINRRDFLRSAALGSVGLGLFAEELVVPATAEGQAAETAGPPVGCAVIGLGDRGREILTSLSKLTNVPIVAICDTYKSEGFLKRSKDIAPSAAVLDDYRKALDMKTVQAVFVATPSHQHRQIAVDALAAGKHVYCEAPLAVSLDDARAIAKAGAASKTVFQAGLQLRCNKMHNHVLNFAKSNAQGQTIEFGGHYRRKASWKRGGTPEREAELNWRLKKATSLGLPGEIGIHQIDVASWFLRKLPTAVTAWGRTVLRGQDGMEVPDTVQVVVDYPGGVRMVYDATLCSSFDSSREVLIGTDAAMLIRDQRAWMFKETDSALLGWEVYAKKERMAIGDDSSGVGIMLVADATKLINQGKEPSKVGTDVTKTALFYACERFINAIRTGAKSPVPAEVGYQANVVAAKAHEASMAGSRIVFQKEWFDLT
jgi:predicted dehydrogenase